MHEFVPELMSVFIFLLLTSVTIEFNNVQYIVKPGSYFIKVKIILSFKFKINLIFYFVKECKKNMFLKFFFGIEDQINIKLWLIKNLGLHSY